MYGFDIYTLISVIFGGIWIFGLLVLEIQIYNLTIIDAKARGFKHPKFWAIFNLGGNNGSGNLILYLLGRRKYPIKNLSEEDKKEFIKRKKKARIALLFFIIGILGLIFSLIMLNKL